MRSLGPYFVCLALALPLSIGGTEIVQYSRNTLDENGRWVNAKALTQMSVMGARHFGYTRNSLQGNRLHLDAWHAFNEVYINDVFEPRTIEFSFRLEDQAHLSVIAGRTTRGFLGARFSRHEEFPAMLFRGERSGRFTERSFLPDVTVNGSWHRARLSFADGVVVVALDGVTVGSLATGEIGEQAAGFRGGYGPTEVDDVRVVDVDGKVVIDEAFRNTTGYWRVFLAGLGLAFALLLTVFAAFSAAARHRNTGRPWQWVVMLTLVFSISGSVIYAFDVFLWSRSYFYGDFNPQFGRDASDLLIRIERARGRFFRLEREPAEPAPVEGLRASVTDWDLVAGFPSNHRSVYHSTDPGRPTFLLPDELLEFTVDSDAYRVVFVGTSQTNGSGAEVFTDALVSRIHRSLSNRSRPGSHLQFINLAIPGSFSGELLETFREHSAGILPQMTIVNLSYNDRNLAAFEDNVGEIIEASRSQGGRTILVVEPATIDRPNSQALWRRHDVLRQLGRAAGVPVLDLQSYMSDGSVYDSGFLWWDQIHMTSYGQSLAADWLAERIEPYFLVPVERP